MNQVWDDFHSSSMLSFLTMDGLWKLFNAFITKQRKMIELLHLLCESNNEIIYAYGGKYCRNIFLNKWINNFIIRPAKL